jgi:hypothetical protein
MTKPTMNSQWDPGNYRPLDMSKIPGYPRKMPLRYEDFLPCFAGFPGNCPESHMMEFWTFFQCFPIDDKAEDLVMKLFASSLHGRARRWYINLPDASISSMEHFEKVFLAKWSKKIGDIQPLLKELEGIKKTKSESIRDYSTRFWNSLYQIRRGYRPEDKYLADLYTNGLQAPLSFFLSKKKPKTLTEALGMAIRIEKNLSLTGANATDILSLTKLVSHANFVENTQEKGGQIVGQQNENVIEEQEPEQELEQDDEVSTIPPPIEEVIQEPVSPVQQKKDEVSSFPFQISNNFVLLDEEEMDVLEKVEVPCCALEEAVHEDEETTHDDNTQDFEIPAQEETVSCPPLINFDDALPCNEKEEEDQSSNPACYDTDTDIADFDEFIHVGRRRWDVVGSDLDPIYDIESHLQLLPLQLSQQITNDQWQPGDEVFTCSLQNTKDDLVPCFSDNFQSYLEMFDEYAEHLNPFFENDYQSPLCSDFDTSKDIVCLRKVAHDFSPQPPVITLPCFSIEGLVEKYFFLVELPPGQTLDLKGRLGDTFSDQCFNLLLMICQSSTRLLSILSLECEDVLGNQSTGPLCPFSEPCAFYDPFLDRIECLFQRWTWQHVDPPTRLHELDSDFSDDVIYVLTHDVFVLDFSLFWFMMKHKGRYQGPLLDWLHWLFDYTNMWPAGKYR